MSLEIKKMLDGHLPTEKITCFSLLDPTSAALQKWVDSLPMLNVGSTAKQIFTTVQELAILDITDSLRFEMMEILRPAIETIIASMSKHYLNQNLMHDQRAERIAQITQQMRAISAMIYHGIATRTLQHYQTQTFGAFDIFKKKSLVSLMSKATHRGLAELYALLLKIKTLHLSDCAGLWLRLHELYRLAQRMGLAGYTLEDLHQSYGTKLSIKQMYLRPIFLSICHTHKLRQSEIKKIGQLSELWVGLIQLSSKPSSHDLLYVDPNRDIAPLYTQPTPPRAVDCLYINVDALIQHVEHLNGSAAQLLHPDEGILLSTSLKQHLLHSLQGPKERASERQAQDGELTMALGFIGVHYQLAGERPLSELINAPDQLSMMDFGDIYTNLNLNYEMVQDDSRSTAMDDYVVCYPGNLVNASATGYCVRWAGTPPRTLRTGELISLKKADASVWQVGLVRWVQPQQPVDPQSGLEILSERGIACGARVIREDGQSSDYMRALLLPHDGAHGKSTLITPAQLFKSGHKVCVKLGDEEVNILLEREVLATQSFSQFEFVVESVFAVKPQTLNQMMS